MTLPTTPKSVLFVCLGNICRSPSAESVMRNLSEQAGLDITFDSAGVAGYHRGEHPDDRAIQAGKSMGYDLSTLRARQVDQEDFYRFDLILAMDNGNLESLKNLKQKIDNTDTKIAELFMFDQHQNVADPYYGDINDFYEMFHHIERMANVWISRWQNDR